MHPEYRENKRSIEGLHTKRHHPERGPGWLMEGAWRGQMWRRNHREKMAMW